jgi:hypothetical protein
MEEGLFEWAREYHARSDDPDTSFIAQLLLEEQTIQAMLRMDLLVHGKNPAGLTDEEVRGVLAQLWPSLRIHDRNHSKRCSDLEIHCGYLEDSGLRRLNATGRPAKVRRITAEGVAALAAKAPLKVPPASARRPRKAKGVWVDLVMPS